MPLQYNVRTMRPHHLPFPSHIHLRFPFQLPSKEVLEGDYDKTFISDDLAEPFGEPHRLCQHWETFDP